MTNVVEFKVKGSPVAQPRARTMMRGGFAHIYTPDKQVKPYKASIRRVAEPLFSSPLTGPVAVEIVAVFERPRSRLKKSSVTEWHTKRPDADNVAKAILDALTGIAWLDDTQVCDLTVKKLEAGYGDTARIEVTIRG